MATSAGNTGGHVMISYQWDNQDAVLQIRDRVRDAGFEVWMDVDNMNASIYDCMAEAVNGAFVILCCMSKKYQESVNCKRELSFAADKEKNIIPLLMQKGYKADGWLGLLIGGECFYAFHDSNDQPFHKLIPALQKAAEAAGVQQPGQLCQTGAPKLDFCLPERNLKHEADRKKPLISSILALPDGRFIIADRANRNVKIISKDTTPVVGSFGTTPWALAMLHDDLVAVTSQDKSIILLLKVTPDLSLFKKINTGRLYRGVACGGKDGKLIVSCSADDGNPAKVDKIERNGEVSQTESIELPPKTDPRFLCVVGNDVLVSDKESNSVFRVDWNAQINRNQNAIEPRYTDNDLKSPRQLATDRDGNIYVATRGGRAVLMLQPGGKCRKLLDGNKHGIGNCSRGQSVAVTASNMVVVVWAARNDSCVVAGYNLNNIAT